MTEFSQKLTRQILPSWQSACMEAPEPWLATPGLRKVWLSDAKGGDPAAAIALARCARLNKTERVVVEEYFLGMSDFLFSPDILAGILISGASPPMGWLAAYFDSALSSPTPLGWETYCRFLRHPGLPPELSAPPDPFGYFYRLHPRRRRLSESRWDRASACWLDGLDDDGDPLCLLGRVLRCDQTAEEVLQLGARLPSEFLFACLQHPARFAGPCPPYAPESPHRDAMRYFAQPLPVCAVHRYHNPLLLAPWLMDTIDPVPEGGMLCAFGLAGAPVSLFVRPLCEAGMEQLRDHPSVSRRHDETTHLAAAPT